MAYMTYKELKAFAKKQMKPVTGTLIGATVLLLAFNITVQLPAARVRLSFITSPVLRYVLAYLVLILANALRSMLQIGFANLSLKVCCGGSVSAGDLFYAFAHQIKNGLLLSLFTALIAVLPLLPYSILRDWYPVFFGTVPFTLRFLTYVPGFILTTLLRVIYSQAFYLMLDFPSCSAAQLLKNSRMLMRGHKKRYLFLQIRLVLLYLAGSICTLLIGALWLFPFTSVVNAKFYLDLVTKRNLAEPRPSISE